MRRSRGTKRSRVEEINRVYQALFENNELKKYIRKEVKKYVEDLSPLRKKKLRNELMIEGDLVQGIISFMKEYSKRELDGKVKKSNKVSPRKPGKSPKKSSESSKVKKPSEIASILSVTKKDEEPKQGWYERAKTKLLTYLPKLIELGTRISNIIIHYAKEVVKFCTSDFRTAGACYTALWTFCSFVNGYQLEGYDFATRSLIYTLQTACYYIPMPIKPFNREKQKKDRAEFIESINEKSNKLSPEKQKIVAEAVSNFTETPWRNLRGTVVKDREKVNKVLREQINKSMKEDETISETIIPGPSFSWFSNF